MGHDPSKRGFHPEDYRVAAKMGVTRKHDGEHPKKKEAKEAARSLSKEQAIELLNNYTPVHSMREHVGWFSQSCEDAFKRELGIVAGIIKSHK